MKRRHPDIYPSDVCLSCQRHIETQAHLWSYPYNHERWNSILNRVAEELYQLLQPLSFKNLPSLTAIQHLLYESRTFISKGIVSNIFFDFVHNVVHSLPTTNTILVTVYNFIYKQIFTHI